MCVCVFFKLPPDQVLGFRLDLGLKPGYYLGEKGESTCKGKILVQIKPCCIVDFSSYIFLTKSSLGKSLIYCIVYVLSSI